ncbi:MAG: formate dehydrogenase accessory sulfurtransferase FdhD [Planctomycetes bacterium]|nr:formate dehydrogenase accessory sulfurtransferase FdhD [Planctomycetota bacterium]
MRASEDLVRRFAATPAVGDTLRLGRQALRAASKSVLESQPVFRQSGGTHAIGVFDAAGALLACAEDIGRHNALDKAIGKCLLAGVETAGRGAALSGRVSLEMVGKCARAGIELISAVSAPTSLAIEAAERWGITLCAFVREARATVFTHARRVVG